MAYVDFIKKYPTVADPTLSVSQRIKEALRVLELSPAIKAHAALCYAISILEKNPDYRYRVTSHLYPAIAKELGDGNTASMVERAIRHGIKTIEAKKTDGFKLLFGNPGLTNAELISVLFETVCFKE